MSKLLKKISEKMVLLRLSGIACLATAAPLTSNEYLMFLHFPKSGGTTMRTVLDDISKKLNTTFQVQYGGNQTRDGLSLFDRLHPGHIAYGHDIHFDSLQPITPGRSTYYATMVRSPVAWALSLHLYLRDIMHYPEAKVGIVNFLRGQVEKCPALARQTNTTRCSGQMAFWTAGLDIGLARPRRQDVPDTCQYFRAFWTHPSHLLLINERYDDSIWLLYQMFGLDAPAPASTIKLNARGRKVYEETIALHEVSSLATTISETCIPDIYDAARERFEHIHRLAWNYCAPNTDAKCSLAGSKLRRELWTPATAETIFKR